MANYFLEKISGIERYRSFESVISSSFFQYEISGGMEQDREKYFESLKLSFENQGSRIVDRPLNAPDKPIQLAGWKEVILKSMGNHDRFPNESLNLGVTNSYEIQAQRAGYLAGLNPLMVLGVSITSDERLILGVRVGKVEAGKISLVPMGYASYSEAFLQDPFYDGIHQEIGEELGWESSQLSSLGLVGLVEGDINDPTFNGSVLFTFLAKRNDVTSKEVIQKHEEALLLYNNLLSQGKGKLEIKQELVKAGFYSDAWEHDKLFAFEPTRQNIENLIQNGTFDGNLLLDVSRTGLYLIKEIFKL